MTLIDSILTALFCMAVVFIVLLALWAAIRLFSLVFALIGGQRPDKRG